jgi:peptidoglycan hydrolase-like protein with peptidoglycan-binding domain
MATILLPALTRGDRGQKVRNWQGLLNAHGAALVIDGLFGLKTESATATVQDLHGLDPDGTVTLATWKAVLGA